MSDRVLRNYRTMGPGPFHRANQKIYKAATDETRSVAAILAGNPELRSKYLATSEKHDAVYHEALYGSKLAINERDILQVQLTILLDEIALLYEAAAIHNPEVLVGSGFDLAKDRRSSGRAKAAKIAAQVPTSEQQEQEP